ncbi:MAG TPA: hypothetical protein VJ201_01185 [Candidatus Babeliales bacterium]|nr:hypothetical protein [Candidatus Babeliales bacterium]
MKLSKKTIVLLFPLMFINNAHAMLRSGARGAARAAAAYGMAQAAYNADPGVIRVAAHWLLMGRTQRII